MATAKKTAPAKKVATAKKIAPAKKAAPKKNSGPAAAVEMSEIEKLLLVQSGFKPIKIVPNDNYPIHNNLHRSFANIAGTVFANFGYSGECMAFVSGGELLAIVPLPLFKSQMNGETNVTAEIGEAENKLCEVSAGQVLFYDALFLDKK